MHSKIHSRVWAAGIVAAALAAILAISLGALPSASSQDVASSDKEKAVEIALSDPNVEANIGGNDYRVVDVTRGNHDKYDFDYTVTIYVYRDSRAIGANVDLAENKVVDVFVKDNTIGPMPSQEEAKVAYDIATADARFVELAGGREFAVHAHQIAKSNPDDPCHTHRCISISLDPIESDGTITRHYSVFYVDLATNEVNMVLLRPFNLDLDVPGQRFVEYDLEDFRGRAISVQEAREAVKVFLSDEDIVKSLSDKEHLLLLSSTSNGQVVVSSSVMVDEVEFIDYARATVSMETSALEDKEISPYSLDELAEAVRLVNNDASVKEYTDNASFYHTVMQPGPSGMLETTIIPLSGETLEAVVDVASSRVGEVSVK